MNNQTLSKKIIELMIADLFSSGEMQDAWEQFSPKFRRKILEALAEQIEDLLESNT